MIISEKWDKRFLKLAEHIATWSKDPSTQVGAVITLDKIVIAHGFNGFASGVSDDARYLHNREEKYPRTIHAELNAILTAKKDLKGHTMYCTHNPCASCTSAIIQSGIRRIVTYKPDADFRSRWNEDIGTSEGMCEDSGTIINLY